MTNTQYTPEIRATFAKRLKELRIPRGFKTARKLAQTLGIDENRYTRYERAEVEPDLGLLVKICAVLDVTPNDLLGAWPSEPSRGMSDSTSHSFLAQSQVGERTDQRRSALAWQIATQIIRIEMNGEHDEPATGLAGLQRISVLYSTIMQDPYSFVASVATRPTLTNATHEAQDSLASLMAELLAETQRSALPLAQSR